MSEVYNHQVDTKETVSFADRAAFRMMSLIHEDLYSLLRDPYEVLKAAGLEPGQDVLEVGCGPGFFTVPAATIVGEGGTLYALDVNPLAVEKVQRKVAEAGVTNVKTVLADAARSGLPDESFDLVFLFGLARPVGGPEAIWVEMHRLLEPGGILTVEGRLQPDTALFRLLGSERRIARFSKIQ
jgi:ubiquinone/menaquinone biosynthesis C-methylase UbiE